MAITLFVMVLVACSHWAGGLLGASLWFVWRIHRSGEIPAPPAWPAWLVAAGALLGGTILSANPSGLQWAGLLQWLSLLCGLWALQDLLRRDSSLAGPLMWGLLCAGGMDAAKWAWASVLEYWRWWDLRVEDLPLFPFRIRLFGSHGPTQAAAWLSGLILLALSWKPTSRRGGLVDVGWTALLIAWSLLLGLCDSRLAYGGFLVGLAVRSLLFRPGKHGLWLAPIPAAVWWIRDLVHPSTVASGGGIGLGDWTLALVGALLFGGWAIARWKPIPVPTSRSARTLVLASSLFPILIPLVTLGLSSVQGLDAASTGRLSFWSVAFKSWQEEPILGVGPWSYIHEVASTTDWTFGFLAMHPHNAFLETLLAGGGLLVVALLGIAFAIARAPLVEGTSEKFLRFVPVLVSLSVGMSFDSPLSSPQVMTLLLACCGAQLASCPVSSPVRVPRTMVLAPCLLLVPLSLVWERQVSKAPLLEARELLREQKWQEASAAILEGAQAAPSDPQWERNVLLARTMRASTKDSLAVLVEGWRNQAVREPGFLPNQIHLRWVEWRLHPGEARKDSVRSVLDRLGRSNEGLPSYGQVVPWWRTTYPTDDPTFWRTEIRMAFAKGEIPRARWIQHWLMTRFPGGQAGKGNGRLVLGARGAPEAQLYGCEGTGWLLIPQIPVSFPEDAIPSEHPSF